MQQRNDSHASSLKKVPEAANERFFTFPEI
jgi:hypothetical protein